MSTRSATEIRQTDNGASKSAVASKAAAMQELRDELLAVERDRQEGHCGCSLNDLDSYLNRVIAEV